MKTFRIALIATAMAVVAVPSTAVAAPEDDAVRELADTAAELVAEEQALLRTTDQASRLRVVDGTGTMLLEQFDELDVRLTAATRAALSPLPAEGAGFAPPSQVYDAALDDLMRISATPSAVLPTESGSSGPALGLLAVAAMSLLVLGAAALANSLRRESDGELAAMAWSDGLTGLANRRRLDHDLETHQLDDESIAAIMVDVDHFKSINDRFGHQEGDEVLRRIASMLAAHVRYDDVVYRYGGEEFCILLPGATHDDAVGVANRIVEAARTIILPDDTHLTVSAGVAHVDDADAATTVESADRALIAAKTAGRDRMIDAASIALEPA
ncbi:MAG: GGDEF domain-containing protein [Ilumatobacter sp.]|nr:GGDEF domain-containing protein [Ilumatobacter sp.]